MRKKILGVGAALATFIMVLCSSYSPIHRQDLNRALKIHRENKDDAAYGELDVGQTGTVGSKSQLATREPIFNEAVTCNGEGTHSEKINPMLRKSLDLMYAELQKADESQLVQKLTKLWVEEYSSGYHSYSFRLALSRALSNGSIVQAVRGFKEGITHQLALSGEAIEGSEIDRLQLLVFMAIPESEWKDATSPAGARGPYQFMWQTAKRYGLVSHKGDFRKDVYLSARAAGRYITDLYLKFGRDIELALAAYNSGMPLKYYAEAQRVGVRPTYLGYVRYLYSLLDREYRKSVVEKVRARNGDTVRKLLLRHGIRPTTESITSVCDYNDIPECRLYPGQEVYIPVWVQNTPSLDLGRQARFIRESLNHPPKCLATIEVLKSQFPEFIEFVQSELNYGELVAVAKARGIIPYNEILASNTNKSYPTIRHIVRPGEEIKSILSKYGYAPTKENILWICGKGCGQLAPGRIIEIPRRFSRGKSEGGLKPSASKSLNAHGT